LFCVWFRNVVVVVGVVSGPEIKLTVLEDRFKSLLIIEFKFLLNNAVSDSEM